MFACSGMSLCVQSCGVSLYTLARRNQDYRYCCSENCCYVDCCQRQTSVLASFKKKMRFDTVPWQVMINYGTKVFAACIHPVPELLRGTLTRSSQQIHRRYRCPETIRRLCSTECVSLSVSIQQSNILIVNEMMPEYQAELILLLTTF